MTFLKLAIAFILGEVNDFCKNTVMIVMKTDSCSWTFISGFKTIAIQYIEVAEHMRCDCESREEFGCSPLSTQKECI